MDLSQQFGIGILSMLFGYFCLLMFIGGVVNNLIFFFISFIKIYLVKIMLLLDNSLVKSEYLILLVFLIFTVILTVIIVGASFLVARQNPESEKLSAYECGFEAFEDSRSKFDVRYYLVAILFIIFDLEITFFLPWALALDKLSIWGFGAMFVFLLELVIGYFVIWKRGALEWE